jgi:hypothetical protein
LADEIKLMLGELQQNISSGGYRYANRLPDQETFLLHMHGSKLHMLRAYFPGVKSSAVYCGKKNLPVHSFRPNAPAPVELPPNPTIDEHYEYLISLENWESAVQSAAFEYKTMLGGEVDMKTFRVLATRELDLWVFADFKEAVMAVGTLMRYLMGGHAAMGIMQKQFARYRANIRLSLKLTEDETSKEEIENVNDRNDKPETGIGRSTLLPAASARTSVDADEADGNHERDAQMPEQRTVEVIDILDGASSSTTVRYLRRAPEREAWWTNPVFKL